MSTRPLRKMVAPAQRNGQATGSGNGSPPQNVGKEPLSATASTNGPSSSALAAGGVPAAEQSGAHPHQQQQPPSKGPALKRARIRGYITPPPPTESSFIDKVALPHPGELEEGSIVDHQQHQQQQQQQQNNDYSSKTHSYQEPHHHHSSHSRPHHHHDDFDDPSSPGGEGAPHLLEQQQQHDSKDSRRSADTNNNNPYRHNPYDCTNPYCEVCEQLEEKEAAAKAAGHHHNHRHHHHQYPSVAGAHEVYCNDPSHYHLHQHQPNGSSGVGGGRHHPHHHHPQATTNPHHHQAYPHHPQPYRSEGMPPPPSPTSGHPHHHQPQQQQQHQHTAYCQEQNQHSRARLQKYLQHQMDPNQPLACYCEDGEGGSESCNSASLNGTTAGQPAETGSIGSAGASGHHHHQHPGYSGGYGSAVGGKQSSPHFYHQHSVGSDSTGHYHHHHGLPAVGYHSGSHHHHHSANNHRDHNNTTGSHHHHNNSSSNYHHHNPFSVGSSIEGTPTIDGSGMDFFPNTTTPHHHPHHLHHHHSYSNTTSSNGGAPHLQQQQQSQPWYFNTNQQQEQQPASPTDGKREKSKKEKKKMEKVSEEGTTLLSPTSPASPTDSTPNGATATATAVEVPVKMTKAQKRKQKQRAAAEAAKAAEAAAAAGEQKDDGEEGNSLVLPAEEEAETTRAKSVKLAPPRPGESGASKPKLRSLSPPRRQRVRIAPGTEGGEAGGSNGVDSPLSEAQHIPGGRLTPAAASARENTVEGKSSRNSSTTKRNLSAMRSVSVGSRRSVARSASVTSRRSVNSQRSIATSRVSRTQSISSKRSCKSGISVSSRYSVGSKRSVTSARVNAIRKNKKAKAKEERKKQRRALRLPKGTLHRNLQGQVTFVPYPTAPFIPPRNSLFPSASAVQYCSETNTHQCGCGSLCVGGFHYHCAQHNPAECVGSQPTWVKLFFGQLPYEVTQMQLDWICFTFGYGRTVHDMERIMKYDHKKQLRQPTGCIHAFAHKAFVDDIISGMDRRLLVDDTGVWHAKDQVEKEALRLYCESMKANKKQRYHNRPYDAVSVQLATSSRNQQGPSPPLQQQQQPNNTANAQGQMPLGGFTQTPQFPGAPHPYAMGNPALHPASTQQKPADVRVGGAESLGATSPPPATKGSSKSKKENLSVRVNEIPTALRQASKTHGGATPTATAISSSGVANNGGSLHNNQALSSSALASSMTSGDNDHAAAGKKVQVTSPTLLLNSSGGKKTSKGSGKKKGPTMFTLPDELTPKDSPFTAAAPSVLDTADVEALQFEGRHHSGTPGGGAAEEGHSWASEDSVAVAVNTIGDASSAASGGVLDASSSRNSLFQSPAPESGVPTPKSARKKVTVVLVADEEDDEAKEEKEVDRRSTTSGSSSDDDEQQQEGLTTNVALLE